MIYIHLLECYFIIIETKDTDKSMNDSQKGEGELEFRHKIVHCTILFIWCSRTDREVNCGDRNQWLLTRAGTLGMTRKRNKEIFLRWRKCSKSGGGDMDIHVKYGTVLYVSCALMEKIQI